MVHSGRCNGVSKSSAIVIGAGPAGLTASLELLRRSSIRPIILEATDGIGGLSRTICHNGNRMDIGGHRFFSKSDRVMQWWLEMMPLEFRVGDAGRAAHGELRYQGRRREIPAQIGAPNPQIEDRVMLLRTRKSRIYFLHRFFDYPITLNERTLRQLGAGRAIRIGLGYLHARLFPRRDEKTLEDFFINRFGTELYRTFFKSYTEKVWGAPCSAISAEWGAQRVKGLSLRTAIAHYLKATFSRPAPGDISQRNTETSLVERFLYPKYGPGQLWEHVAGLVREGGGEIHLGITVDRIEVEGDRVVAVEGVNGAGQRSRYRGDYFLSTMPVRDLIRAFSCPVPREVAEIGEGLIYRDFIAVGLLLSRLNLAENDGSPLKDTWIYIQEPDVKIGRLQIFNNWSPWMVEDPDKVWIGLELFCSESDPLWKLSDGEIANMAIEDAAKIGLIRAEDVEDSHVVRVPKAYPSYFGSYDRFEAISQYIDGFRNLYLVGRNGMHRYNNQDHSMLTAMAAVENIIGGAATKRDIWAINTEMDYHEG
jgi:protoporphyrinogen oxidase